ncbi:MAG: F0F1 ATP synthase subunit gamma [Candidatus Babeliaceae bacterium]|nr:F0F1 ATP synthase subunit gamma [Candidatus Babeliaceae bacterium]
MSKRMPQLITIAERIKVITNIRKTAHAMQLISMSTLSRLGIKKKNLQVYTQQLEILMQELGLTLVPGSTKEPLYLIIGSQKGFCGSFNITLFNFIKELQKKEPKTFSCIALGPYAHDFCKAQKMPILHDKIIFSLTNLSEKTDIIFNILSQLKHDYDSVVILGNYNASIFLQRPEKTILPLHYNSDSKSAEQIFELEQPISEIVENIGNLILKNRIYYSLLESLRAENSARALSMDNSTRNAKNLLTEMKLEYNKIRQAKVTKELTELSSAMIY